MNKQIKEKDLPVAIYMSGHGLDWADSKDIANQLYEQGYQKQKQGEWLVTEQGCVITCSNCNRQMELYYSDGTEVGPALPYCPYCGSKNKEN